MNKKTNFSKYPILRNPMLYVMLIAMLGIASSVTAHYGARRKIKRELTNANIEFHKNELARNAYVTYASEITQNPRTRMIIDSIENRNDDLIGIALDKYFSKLDAKYTMGRFFDAKQIAQINRILASHIHKISKSDDIVYKYAKSYMPMGALTPLRAFEDVVGYLNITPAELMPCGVEFDNGAIFTFDKTHARHLFYQYMNDYDAAYAQDNEPNFDVAEFASARDEYVSNRDKIFDLERQIERNDSIVNKNLATFDAKRDSLNFRINTLRQKLK